MATRLPLFCRRALGSRCGSARLPAARCLATASDAPVYVVFGAAGGVGAALTSLLAHQGGLVLAVGRDPARLAAAPWASLASVTPLVADAGAPGGADAALAACLEQHGRLAGVANCIGSVLLKPAHQTSDAELAAVMATNLGTAFSVLRASVKAMKTGGSLVLCSSAVASHGLANHEAIAAAKGAVAGLALSAAATYAPQNVRVNCVSPGLTRTPMTARITGSEVALKMSV
jgi:NAD(P)-dependent dehydrogenase (short-subunit alcohol dehydrogenase family)